MIKNRSEDIHILKYFSSFVSVSGGKVINVTEPKLSFCPLAGHLYPGFRRADRFDKEALKNEIRLVIEAKIRDCGFFTGRRKLLSNETAIPCGASEMLMYALNKKIIDAAVVVCDGAGTVITERSGIVQGIGGRMNSLVVTSPIPEIKSKLRQAGCHIVFDNALIDQKRGVEEALALGYKKIAVTVCGHDAGTLQEIRGLEPCGSAIYILAVCTTGITGDSLRQIRLCADVVWSCASREIREKIGPAALLQISQQIPVFILTQKGMNFIAAYAQDSESLKMLDGGRQYLISHEPRGSKVQLGGMKGFLREEKLPVLPHKSFAIVA